MLYLPIVFPRKLSKCRGYLNWKTRKSYTTLPGHGRYARSYSFYRYGRGNQETQFSISSRRKYG